MALGREARARENLVQTMQARESVLFVAAQVAQGVERDRRQVPAIGVNTQCGLLSQDARGKEECGLLTQQVRNFLFELGDYTTFAVAVRHGVARNLIEEARNRPLSVTGQVSVALHFERLESGATLASHRLSLYRAPVGVEAVRSVPHHLATTSDSRIIVAELP